MATKGWSVMEVSSDRWMMGMKHHPGDTTSKQLAGGFETHFSNTNYLGGRSLIPGIGLKPRSLDRIVLRQSPANGWVGSVIGL